MSISLQTNVDSLVAQRNLGVNSQFQSNVIQQLSSGYRINSSADDAAGLAIAKAAQHKTVGLLSKALESDGVYVGEVVVTGLVKGTAFDSGNATLEASTIADRFWQIYSARGPASVTI